MRAPLGIRPYVIETLRRRLDRDAAPVTVAAVREAARALFAERRLAASVGTPRG
jgi:hypothetical protein